MPDRCTAKPSHLRFGGFLLNVDEIVRHIASELVASGRKAAAVCLACCRKSFEDLVLDAQRATQIGPSSSVFRGMLGMKADKR